MKKKDTTSQRVRCIQAITTETQSWHINVCAYFCVRRMFTTQWSNNGLTKNSTSTLIFSCLPLDAMSARHMLSSRVCLSVCPSVCLSQARIVSKRLDESSWFLAWRLPPTYPTLCFEEISVSPKLEYFSLELCLIGHSNSIALSTKLVDVVDGRACWRHLYDSRRVVAVYYKSINRNPLNSITAICCAFVAQLVSTVDKILTDIVVVN